MKQEGLLFFTDTWMTLLGLLIFFTFFIVMFYRVMKTKNDHINKMSNLPLEDSYEQQ